MTNNLKFDKLSFGSDIMNPLFNNEKHYLTLNNYCLNRFGEKMQKISLNGNFTCPNRDGTISTLGCLFCSAKGSGDFAGEVKIPLKDQFEQIRLKLQTKWPTGSYIAYFQANTNTYGSLTKLKETYGQIITPNGPINDKIKVLSIATRPDTLEDEKIAYLKELNQIIPVWIELGFQTMHEETATYLNRGYSNRVFVDTVKRLQAAGLPVIVHIINGLPNETKAMMIETVKFLNSLKIDGLKIHMLHVMKNTPLGEIYLKMPFPMLTLEEYVDIVVTQLSYLNENIVIHRVTGDAPKDLLIVPEWTLKKFVVINEIDKLMRKKNIFQGALSCTK